MNGLVNQKLARLNLEPISATQGLLRSGSSGIIRLPIVQNDVIVIPAVLKCRKTNCLRCWKETK
jgi:membrane fusion protein (multidrug efflux system)